jgi:signal transduction histidine kinase/CheY-like chemotaxis protein
VSRTAPTPAAPPAESADEELLLLVAQQARRVPVPVFAVALLTAAMAADTAPAWAVLAWLLLVGTVIAVRRAVLVRLPSSPQPIGRRLRTAAALNLASGVSHGLAVAFVPYLGDYERVVQTLLLQGLCTGAVATTVGQRALFTAFLMPMVVPLSLAWLLGGGTHRVTWIEAAIALFVALLALILLGLARDLHRMFLESFEMRRQQSAMNLQLREALAQAESASRAKTRFLASASHDLRQPMHTLSLFAEALWMRPLDAASRDIAANMRTALLSLGSQLDALLDISKLDARVVEAKPAAVDLCRLLRRLHHEYLPQADRRGLRLLLQCEGSAPCRTDPLLLERILRNLIDNAIKYTAQGEIRFGVDSAGGRHVVRIADTGCGIAADEQARVFEEFYQVGNAGRNRAQGLGLGLSIVKRLADLLGLHIELASVPGQGTTVSLAIEASGAADEPVQPPALAPNVAGLSMLVIDDEEHVRLGMKALLEGLGSVPILAATTDEALAAARDHRPDIVLADFRLGGGDDGLAAIRRLRERHPSLPALLLSGDIAPDRLREAQAAGFRLLHKPVALPLLLQAIDAELAKEGADAVGPR